MKYKIIFLHLIFLFITVVKAEDALDQFFNNQESEGEIFHDQLLEKTINPQHEYSVGNTIQKNAEVVVLNKITAKSKKIKLTLDNSSYFGNIKISLRKAVHSLTENQATESKAFLTIVEENMDEDSKVVFNGWIFSSNIGFNNLQHPIYQIILLSCY